MVCEQKLCKSDLLAAVDTLASCNCVRFVFMAIRVF